MYLIIKTKLIQFYCRLTFLPKVVNYYYEQLLICYVVNDSLSFVKKYVTPISQHLRCNDTRVLVSDSGCILSKVKLHVC